MTLEELRQRIRDIEQERIRSRNHAERRSLAAELRELERMLLTYEKEENIIEEMTQLRRRLKKLQEDLHEIQQTNRQRVGYFKVLPDTITRHSLLDFIK